MDLRNENVRYLLFGALRLIIVPVALFWLVSRFIGSDWWQPVAMSPALLALALLVNQLALATFAARMRGVLLTAKIEVGWLAAMRIHLQSMFYFFVLPMTVGLELARYLKVRAINPTTAAPTLIAALLLDRLLGASSALLLAVMCLPFVALSIPFGLSGVIASLFAAALGLLLGGLLLWPRARRLLFKVWALTKGRRFALSGLFVLSIFMHVMLAFAVQLAGRGFGFPLTFVDTCFAVAGGMLLVVIPVSLAGLGPAEAGAAALFAALGYEPSVAIAAGALPYLLRLIGAVEGGAWEIIEGGVAAFGATRSIIAQSNLPRAF